MPYHGSRCESMAPKLSMGQVGNYPEGPDERNDRPILGKPETIP